MKEYKPIVENKGQSGGSVCRIPLLNWNHEKEGYTGDKRGILYLAYDIADAINTIHTYKGAGDENSIAHRDIKPENIFYDEKANRFLLGDFGLARITDRDSASTCAGTRGFAAPEISLLNTENGESYDALKADIYSFGKTLFVLLNELAFPGGRSGSFSNMNSNFFPTEQKNSRPPCDGFESINLLISDMIKINPAERNMTSEDVLSEIKVIYSDEFPGERKKLENSIERRTEVNLEKNMKSAVPAKKIPDNNNPVNFSYLKSTEENSKSSEYYKPESYSSQIPLPKEDSFRNQFHKTIVTRKMRMPLLCIPAVLLPLLLYVESYYSMPAKVNVLFILSFIAAAIASSFKLAEIIAPYDNFTIYYGFSVLAGIVSLIMTIIAMIMGADTGLSVLILVSLAFLTAYLNEYYAIPCVDFFIFY